MSAKTKNTGETQGGENKTCHPPENEKNTKAPGHINEQDAPDGELAQVKEQLATLNDQLLRTLAEYDNFRKRTQKEREALYQDAVADTLAKLLPTVDNFERALGFACGDEEYKKGMDMIIQNFVEMFFAAGVKEIPAQAGDPFDPQYHNAVMHIEDENMGKNVIAQVLQKGYCCGDKVIRYAMVQVAN